nr:EOG090X0508 [Macrothrix elegans]
MAYKKFKRKKKNPNRKKEEPEELKRAPHSFVIVRGNVGRYITRLMRNFRRVMEPNTACNLRSTEKNSIKDFVNLAGPLHVSHFIMFSRSELSPYMRICRLPHGPTLTFRVLQYSLAKDVVGIQKRPHINEKQFQTAPLVVLNNFSGEELKLQLMTSMFQNMFPSINIATVNLQEIRRCVLFHYNSEDDTIEFRHYSIRTVPVGVSKAVKKLVQNKVPNLAKFEDISDFIEKAGQLSDSEGEDDPSSGVILPQNMPGRASKAGTKSAVRLSELGPRIRLKLMKIEEGVVDGEVLYHQYIQKTDEEKKLIRQRREIKRKNDEKVRKIQDAQRKQREEKKELHKQKSIEGMKRKEARDRLAAQKKEDNSDGDDEEDDDDAEYYRQEVGAEPEQGLFNGGPRRSKGLSGPAAKRAKIEKKKASDRAGKAGNKKVHFRDDANRPSGKANRTNADGRGKIGKSNLKPTLKRTSKIQRKR